DPLPHPRIELLAVTFDELRLIVEQVALAGAAIHEKLNDSLDASAVMQAAVEFRLWRIGQEIFSAEQRRHRDAAQAGCEIRKQSATRQCFVGHRRATLRRDAGNP